MATWKLARLPGRQAHLRGGVHWHRACFTGDWKFFKETFGLKYHYGTDQCCHKCHVDKSATATNDTVLTWDSAGFINRRSDEDFKSGAKASLTIPGVHVSALLNLANAVCLHGCICDGCACAFCAFLGRRLFVCSLAIGCEFDELAGYRL